MMKQIRCIIHCTLILSVLMISGCWDSREVENLAVSTLVAWDRVTVDGKDLWQISTRINNMAEKSSAEISGIKPARELLVKGTGITIEDAYNELVRRLPAETFLDHNSAIILGERAAREELPSLMSADLRYPRSRIRVNLLVCQGEANKVLQAQPELSATLSKEIRKIAQETAEQSGSSLNVSVLDFTKQLIRKDRDTVLPLIKTITQQEGEETADMSVEIAGFGVVRDTKMVGWLEGDEALGYILSAGNQRSKIIPLPVKYNDIQFSYFMTKTKGKISSELVAGQPKFKLTIKTEGVVHEASAPHLNSEDRTVLEKAIEKRITDIVWASVNKAKEYDADIFGFNENLHRFHLREWKEIEPEWRQHFQKAEIEVEVVAKIRSFGTSNKGFDFSK